MVYKGHVKNGAIVLDEPAPFPDGAAVMVQLAIDMGGGDEGLSFTERYADLIGAAEGLPEDASENHDHFLYGVPKR